MLSPTGFFGRFANIPLTKGDKHETKKTIRPTTTMSRTFTLQVLMLLMEEIPAKQLRLVVYPTIYKVLYIPGGCWGFLPSTVAPKSQGFLHYVQPFLFHWILFGPTTPTAFFLLLAAWVKRKRLKEFFTKRFFLGVCKSAESSWRNPNFMGGLVSEIRSFIEFLTHQTWTWWLLWKKKKFSFPKASFSEFSGVYFFPNSPKSPSIQPSTNG